MTETIARIMVPVDFSPHADRAFAYAAALARRLGASLELLHVVEDPYATGAWASEYYVPDIPELLARQTAAAEHRLSELKASPAATGLTVEATVIIGRPTQVIVEHAASGKADMIVMGTHGRTGLPHVVMGSVAERIVRKAPCPVLTLKANAALEHPAAA